MSISIFDLFSIGIGPSSSHTVGPMRAAKTFAELLAPDIKSLTTITVTLYGSLAFTGAGHGTDRALLMGLCGETPEDIDPDTMTQRVQHIIDTKELNILNQQPIGFDYETHFIHNYKDKLDYHTNGMRFCATFKDGSQTERTYFSIGGGFIICEEENNSTPPAEDSVPYPFSSAADLLTLCETHNLSTSDVMFANEETWHDAATVRQKLLDIAAIMEQCIDKGCETTGNLEGRLNVRRRASSLYKFLLAQGKPSPTHPQAMNWLNVFAMAVNEENAAGGRVVTAPTNGAAGIIPAVMRYYRLFFNGNEDGIIKYLLTAGAIGILYKKNASISGAEMGCQGEVGVACSMAAAGLADVLGGTIYQVENAAEIAMEHNLGLTCDPIDGLVQIPCIERNAMGAVKAINAAQLALAEDGKHNVSLDAVIKTMYEIGKNMNSIYKETSLGGLAVNVIEC
ncbi:MAG: L-serine ammonia-lyase [Coxiella sp. (in: Bacteria)]|nr:MAG: L-serine ammonia-lyase [Coxiella sp. (in: g-proteobacteria)]